MIIYICFFFFFQAEDGIRDVAVTGVQTCALPISSSASSCWTTARRFSTGCPARPRAMRAWRKSISASGLKPIMLSLVDVSAGYSSLRALFGVSLEVAAGETVGVIGPNGAGKTTLMRVISGLVAAFGGGITLEGRSIAGMPAHRIVERGIAHVPENRRLFPKLSVEDNLRIGAFIPKARAHFAEQLAWVYQLFPRLQERRQQPAGTLSGGEQPMSAIGRALMPRPRLLLMDEPSAGLAPLVVQEVFDLIRRIRAEGLTVLIVEQNIQQVLEVVDRAYLLEVGAIRLAGSSSELKNNEFIRKAYLGL